MTTISGSAWVSSSPASATRPSTTPPAMIARRPNRSDAALAGKAAAAPATDAIVETTPIVAVREAERLEVEVEVDPVEAEGGTRRRTW